ncbi:alpha/beta hydrolase [Alicyclobacillus cycloheptanicus]|uniref:Fermentation-respiration switch protein FrsA (DUF1100 family) n=1 Tax=Alicyclobacillus cycloheptanicus TaxID=1457 RepID=A0ABT9XLE9_9BACL|nr:alpha/beta hydrolase [Alicyclobacillus cycloheptanicus]MDQ0191115.1 fermentation-respiration switch protein FrsA (DUF1100 family) [Alicyclobacillus cycloheptanicus]WDM02747.1 alpha/beta hydrolase [Alicyclobacillus cycloheptanicus]
MQKAVELQHQGLTLRGMLHVPEDGQGPWPAVIIYHGFTADKLGPHQMFVKLSRVLANIGVAVVRFDFSGSGESDGLFQDITVTREVAEANAMLDFAAGLAEVDAARITLVGHSVGGLVASIVAASRPADVRRLVLIAPAGNLREFVFTMARQVGVGGPGGIDPQADVFDLEGNLVGRSFALDLLTLDAYERAKSYTGDVLLVHGTDDATVPLAVSESYQEKVYGGRAQTRFIEGANHTFSKHVWEQALIDTICDFVRPSDA